jgi:hypothetical protein
MAFDLSPSWTSAKYRYTFTGELGTSYIWEIHEDAHNNAGTPVVLVANTRDNCKTSWQHDGPDEYSPLMPSETVVQFFDPNLAVVDDLIENISTIDDKYLIVVRSGNNIKWIGKVDTNGIQYNEDHIPSLTVSATDGLGRLADEPYLEDTVGGGLPNGMASVQSILSGLLSGIGFGLDLYTSTSFLPKTSPLLAATDNPLENIFVNKYVFRNVNGYNDAFMSNDLLKLGNRLLNLNAEIDKDDAAIPKIDVLQAIMTALGAKIFQANGAWHVIQANHLGGATSYRRWRYDSAGVAKVTDSNSPNTYEDITSGVTFSDLDMKRSSSMVSTLPAYGSSIVTYSHGSSNLLRLPTFDNPARNRGVYGEPYPWTSGDAANSARTSHSQGFRGWAINDVDTDFFTTVGSTKIDDFPGIRNGNDTSGSYTSLIAGKTGSQTTIIDSQAGDQLNLQFEVFPVSSGFEIDGFNLLGQDLQPEGTAEIAIAVQVIVNSPTPYYLSLTEPRSGEWVTTPTWMIWHSNLQVNGWNSIYVRSNAIVADGNVTVKLGPILDSTRFASSGNDRVSMCYYDNVSLFPIQPDGAINYTSTSTVNYIDRAKPSPKQIGVALGDGPTGYTAGALYTAADRALAAADWEESTTGHSGTDTNQTLAEVLGRAALTSMNNTRTLHSRSFPGIGQVLTPLDVVLDGSRFVPWAIDTSWSREITSGSWYKASENTFTDDLETGVKDGGTALGAWGRGQSGDSAFIINQLSQTFISDSAKSIARTTAAIPAGSGTASVAVSAISEALLQEDDSILIIAADLSVYRVKLAAPQLAGATSLSFDDPDNPGSNFSFDHPVPIGANIYIVDDDLLTIARLGEQGFAVSVEGSKLGTCNSTIGPSAQTLINVSDWIVSLPVGATVFLAQDDGTEVALTLTSAAPRGSTDIKFTSTSIDVTVGNAISASGTTSRAEFIVTSDKIAAYVERAGDQIATVSASATSGVIVSCTALAEALNTGDTVYFHAVDDGRVIRRVVATPGAAAAATSFTVTAAFTTTDNINDGDPIIPGFLTGLRIDMDGIDVLNTSISSSFDGEIDATGAITGAGSTGWAITKTGEAVFNNITARGSVTATTGAIGGFNIGSDYLRDAANTFGLASTLTVGDDVRFWAGDTFENRAAAPFMLTEAGVLTASSATISGAITATTLTATTAGSIANLTISGTLTMGASGVITNSSGELYIDKDEIVFGNSAANTVSTISLGVISTASTSTLQQASMNTAGFMLTDTSGGPAVTTSLTSQALTSNGNLSLLPSGTLVLDYATFPAADAAGFLYSNGSGTLSWASAAGGGDALVANPLSQFAATTSSQLAGVISDETGTGALVFATAPTFASIANTGVISAGTWQGTAIASAYLDADTAHLSTTQTFTGENTFSAFIRAESGLELDFDAFDMFGTAGYQSLWAGSSGKLYTRAGTGTVYQVITTEDGLVTNATHTGEVTGSGVLTVDVTAITNRTSLASGLANTDEFLVSDSGVLKRVASSVIGSYVDSIMPDHNKCLLSNISDVSVGDTATETTLLSGSVRGSLSVPGNTVHAGTVISIVARGYFTASGTTGITMRFKIGAATIMNTGSVTLGSTTVAGWWEFIGDATVDTAGATGNVWAQGVFRFYNDNSGTYTNAAILNTGVSSSINFTTSATIDFTADWDAADSQNIITCTTLFIDTRQRA